MKSLRSTDMCDSSPVSKAVRNLHLAADLVPTRLHFGRGVRRHAPEWVRENGNRALVVTTVSSMQGTGFLGELVEGLRAAGCAVAHVTVSATGPTTDEVDHIAERARSHRAKALVALGGGSVIDAAKAAAATVGSSARCADLLRGRTEMIAALPLLAIPSTAGTGSEMNRSAILTDPDGLVRDGLRGDQLFPKCALVDPEISASQPRELALRTAFDTLSHAIESYVSPRARADTDGLAEGAMREVSSIIRAIADGGATMAERSDLALWSALMGVNLSRVGTCLPHRIDKAVCALFAGIPHAQSVAFFFPAWLRWSWPGAVEKFARVARCLDPAGAPAADADAAERCGDFAEALLERIGLGGSPALFGVARSSIPLVLDRVAGDLTANPVPVNRENLLQFLEETIP